MKANKSVIWSLCRNTMYNNLHYVIHLNCINKRINDTQEKQYNAMVSAIKLLHITDIYFSLSTIKLNEWIVACNFVHLNNIESQTHMYALQNTWFALILSQSKDFYSH